MAINCMQFQTEYILLFCCPLDSHLHTVDKMNGTRQSKNYRPHTLHLRWTRFEFR